MKNDLKLSKNVCVWLFMDHCVETEITSLMFEHFLLGENKLLFFTAVGVFSGRKLFDPPQQKSVVSQLPQRKLLKSMSRLFTSRQDRSLFCQASVQTHTLIGLLKCEIICTHRP